MNDIIKYTLFGTGAFTLLAAVLSGSLDTYVLGMLLVNEGRKVVENEE